MSSPGNGSNGNSIILEAKSLAKDYFDGTRVLSVLQDVNLQVSAGEIISIVGASGAGKSTLLQLLGILDRPTRGAVLLNGVDLSGMSTHRLAEIRNRSVGFVFQFHHLLAEFTALENVILPGLIMKQPIKLLREQAAEALEGLGLGDRLTHRPAKLSGGEQQRVALARAMANNPDVILADEPTGNLDIHTAETVIDLLWANTRDKQKSLVIVTHEPDIAKRADRCLRLKEGVLVPEKFS